MRYLEFRMDPDAVLPMLEHIESLYPELRDKLAAPGKPPDQDELMSSLWNTDLLNSQRSEIEIFAAIFGPEFKASGCAKVVLEGADRVIRACSALRLKLREKSLGAVDDSLLESGNLDMGSMSEHQQIGYAAYVLLASLQELIIVRIDDADSWSDDDAEEEGADDGNRL